MTSQLSLFDAPAHTLSRRTDPPSSAMAAAEMQLSGALSRQRRAVLDALKQHGPATSAELAARSGIGRYVCARRLPELRALNLVVQGKVRPCAVGRPAVEWRTK
jgi:predicted ArsR family transcriptional regulator